MDGETHIKIVTRRLVLRHMSQSDAAALLAYRCIPEVYRFQTWQPTTLQDTLSFINSTASVPGIAGTWYQMALCHKHDMRLIGDLGIHFITPGNSEIELGCTIKPEQQGYGYATEAMSAIIDYLFHEMEARRITCCVAPQNEKSIRLMARLGLQQTAKFNRNKLSVLPDDLIFTVHSGEWQPVT